MSPSTSPSLSSFPSHNNTITTSSTPSSTTTQQTPPSSILIVGAGVFGLATALALTTRPEFAHTPITVVDRSPTPGVFPARDASSIDTSRIIRADYADPAYAALAAEAQEAWRRQDHPDDLGAEGRYSETGLMLVGDDDDDDAGSSEATHGGRRQGPATKKTGLDYVRASYANVQALHPGSPKITALPSAAAIRTAYGTGGASGSWGYLNGLSGWADAEASMAWLYRRAVATDRITFVNGTVTSLLHAAPNGRVTGVQLSDGTTTLHADLTVLATGAWTPSLIDLSGRAIATGQVVAYLPLTPAEQAKLAHVPTLLNLSTGYFIITPAGNTLKVARHAYGFLNPVSSSPAAATRGSSTVSVPATHLTHPAAPTLVPQAEQAAMRDALRQMVPWPELAERPFSSTRLCWYTDTPDGDFIIDYHPEHQGLFVATGASGHGFKFLPVIGERIVDCILGRCSEAFRGKWDFRKRSGNESKEWDEVVTEDGSRGGVPGLILGEELKRAKASRL